MRSVFVVLAVILLAAGCGGRSGPSARSRSSTSSVVVASTGKVPSCVTRDGEPDSRCTPGTLNPAVTQQTVGRTICVRGWTRTVRPPASYTDALKRRQIAEYGYADVSSRSYEEDHLVPLELGGAPADPANLWPEPRNPPGGLGASVKDDLENALRAAVCSGAVQLAAAQREIRTDWVAAYRRLRPARRTVGGGEP